MGDSSKAAPQALPPRPSNSGNPRGSVTGGAGSPVGGPRASSSAGVRQPRPSGTNYGPQAHRLSSQGSNRKNSMRHSHSSRRSTRSNAGEGEIKLQVLDEEGRDRTPKPLVTLKPSVLRNGGHGGNAPDDPGTPGSEMSEMFFMDRMSSTSFSKAGWYSESASGDVTPKESEADYDYEAQKDRQRKAAEELAAAAAAAEDDEQVKAGQRGALYPAQLDNEGPVLLSERDLDRPVAIMLQETETIFMLEMRCVTVPLDSEEAKAVEEANRRYAQLLVTKAAADKYTDTEAQTLDLLRKAREVQAGVLVQESVAAQADNWDIDDTYRMLDEAAADAEDDRGLASHPGGAMPSLSQLTGGVSRSGANYMSQANTARNSARSGASSVMNFSRQTTAAPHRPDSAASAWGNASVYTAVTGVMAGGGGHSSGQAAPVVGPDGVPKLPLDGVPGPASSTEGEGDLSAPSPLTYLRGLQEALTMMDSAVSQNNYLSKLLLYRNIQPLPGLAGGEKDGPSHYDDEEEEVEPAEPVSKDGATSRPASRGGMSEAPSVSHSAAHSTAQSAAHSMAHSALRSLHSVKDRSGADHDAKRAPSVAGYAASVAESHWPEELLQELADLGDDAPRMEALWDFVCPLVRDQPVACMAWNKSNPDLLAVGYGSSSFSSEAQGPTSTRHGLVAFWSLKNPEWPLWHFETTAAVTAIDFAKYAPNILAVGLYNGTIAVYDVKGRVGSPSMESSVACGSHADPVWQVRWLDRGPERDEVLMSLSTDGRVTQWSIAKGLEFADIMKLKRVPRRQQPAGLGASGAAVTSATSSVSEQQDAFISRLTSGMAFDFSARDERIYIAGTEDGWIHKCSTSYSEQYLESYSGHMGPVYQLQWSPFRKDLFVSCSGDWTIRLWQEGRDTPLLTFVAGSSEINDVRWCPTSSTVFASVTSSGRLEIWDFALSTVKPVMHIKTGVKMSCLLFSPNCPVVVCGGEDGRVKVYRVHNVDREYDTQQEQLDRLEEVIRANVMKTSPQGTQQ